MKMKCMKDTRYVVNCPWKGIYSFFWVLLFLLHSVALSAQNNRKINGTVIDESGEAIIGATVMLRIQNILLLLTLMVYLN